MITKLKLKSEFSRNVLTLMTGTTIAQVIPIAISPILTRIYTPEDFGIFALYMSISSILSVIVTGRYEFAIMLPKKDKDALHILLLSLTLILIISFIIFIIILLFNDNISNFFNNKLGKWLYFIPLSVFLTGVYQSLYYWNNRKRRYQELSKSKIIQSSFTALTNIIVGLITKSSTGLISSSLIGQFLAITYLTYQFVKNKFYLISHISKVKIIFLLKKYKRFPTIFLFAYGLNAIATSSIIWILSSSFDAIEFVGYYLLVTKVIKTPLSIISSSVGNVFFQKITEFKNYKYIYLKVSLVLAIIGVIPTIILFFYGKEIFVLIFGEQWIVAGDIVKVLVIMFYLSFVTIPVSHLSTILQKSIYNILWQVTLILGILLSWKIGKLYNDPMLFLIIYAIIQSGLYIYGYVYEYRLYKEIK